MKERLTYDKEVTLVEINGEYKPFVEVYWYGKDKIALLVTTPSRAHLICAIYNREEECQCECHKSNSTFAKHVHCGKENGGCANKS